MMVRIVLNHAYNKFAPNKKCIQYNSQFFVTCRAELGALKTLSSGRLPRFLFAAIESFIWRNKEDHAPQCGLELYGWGSLHPVPPSATIGGLRTVVRLQYYGSDCPQPRPQAPNCPLGKDEAPARAVRMSLYGWGMCPQGIAPSLSIHRTHIETRQDQILGQEADLTVKHKIFSPHL